MAIKKSESSDDIEYFFIGKTEPLTFQRSVFAMSFILPFFIHVSSVTIFNLELESVWPTYIFLKLLICLISPFVIIPLFKLLFLLLNIFIEWIKDEYDTLSLKDRIISAYRNWVITFKSVFYRLGLLLVVSIIIFSGIGIYNHVFSSWEWAIYPEWDHASDFSEGFAVVEKDGKCGYIDKSGKLILKSNAGDWTNCIDFDNGVARIQRDNGKTYEIIYIKKSGDEIQNNSGWDYNRSDWDRFSEGFAVVKKDGVCGYIDQSGKLVLKSNAGDWANCSDFDNDMARIQRSNGKAYETIYISKSGDEIQNNSGWDYNRSDWDRFSEGFAVVKKDGVCGYIDQSGNLSLASDNNDWLECNPFKKGIASIRLKDSTIIYINQQGNLINKDSYLSDKQPYPKADKIGKDEYIYVDKNGGVLFEKHRWAVATDFLEGIGRVAVVSPITAKVKWGFIRSKDK